MKQNVALDSEEAHEDGLENPVCQGQSGVGTAVQYLGHHKN